jgi:hypothetical protein
MPRILFLPVMSLLLSPVGLLSQNPENNATSNAVVVVQVNHLDPPNAKALLIRRPTAYPPNVILVTPSTTPAELARAMATMIRSRAKHGNQVPRELRAPISEVQSQPRSMNEKRALSDLARLKNAPEVTIPGLAQGKYVVLYMIPAELQKRRSQ